MGGRFSARELNPLDYALVLAARAPFQGSRLRTFTQKVLFRAELDTVGLGLPGFIFYRWNNGPYSKAISEAEKWLAKRNLIEGTNGPLSPHGRRVHAVLKHEASQYPELARAWERVARCAGRYSRMSLDAVCAEVYSLEVVTEQTGLTTVLDAAPKTVLLRPQAFDEHPYRSLVDLAWWMLTTPPEKLRAEEESPLMDPADAARLFEELGV